jgi:hypothetical protein
MDRASTGMKDNSQSSRADGRVPDIVEPLALAATVVAGIVLLMRVLWCCRLGVDFTDEGSYLVWMSDPWFYRASTTQFGFIYHPLYKLVGGDIVLLRQSSILITLGLAWLFGIVLLRTLEKKSAPPVCSPRFAVWGIAFVLATSTLAHLDPWLPTPGYNILALQALLLAGTGILMAGADDPCRSIAGWAILGLSGWLSFMAKPTTALGLAIVAAAFLVAAGTMNSRRLALALAVALALFLISAYAIDGSVRGFVARLSQGAQDAGMLQGGHTLAEAWRWDESFLGGGEKIALLVMTLTVSLAAILSASAGGVGRLGGALMTIVFAVACSGSVAGLASVQWASTPFRGMLYWAVPFGAWLGALVVVRGNFSHLISRWSLALVLCLVVFPHAYAFGSNGNYWWWAPRAAVFWVLAGIPLPALRRGGEGLWRAVLPVAAAALLITAALLRLSMEAPYRQPPLSQDKEPVQVASTGSRLLVAREVSEYLQSLGRLAREGGFHAGDLMLDLSGHYPGALYLIGARPVGRPWMIGGYPGSDDLAAAVLDRVPAEDLRKSWILCSPTGPRKLSSDLLKKRGLDLARDYEEVGIVRSPKGEYPYSIGQRLLRPVRRAVGSAPGSVSGLSVTYHSGSYRTRAPSDCAQSAESLPSR